MFSLLGSTSESQVHFTVENEGNKEAEAASSALFHCYIVENIN